MNLPIEGETVTGVDLTYSLTLDFGKRRIRIETDFELIRGNQITKIAAGDDEVTDVDPAIFKDARVLSATFDDDGSLFLTFDSGYRIVVNRDREYESWEFSGFAGEGILISPDVIPES